MTKVESIMKLPLICRGDAYTLLADSLHKKGRIHAAEVARHDARLCFAQCRENSITNNVHYNYANPLEAIKKLDKETYNAKQTVKHPLSFCEWVAIGYAVVVGCLILLKLFEAALIITGVLPR